MRNSANIIIVQGQEYAETEMSVRSVVTIDKDMILKDNDFSFEIKIKYMGCKGAKECRRKRKESFTTLK